MAANPPDGNLEPDAPGAGLTESETAFVNAPPVGESIVNLESYVGRYVGWTLQDVDDAIAEDLDIYVKMRCDGVVLGCLQLLMDSILANDPQWLPRYGEGHPLHEEAEAQASFFAEMASFMETPLLDVLEAALEGVADGFSTQEIIYKHVDMLSPALYQGKVALGKWGWKAIKAKDPRVMWVETDDWDNVTGYKNTAWAKGLIEIDPAKVWAFTPRMLYSRPIGVSFLRGAVKWWKLKVLLCQNFGVYSTGYASGIWKGTYPRGWSAKLAESMLTNMQNMSSSNSILIPADGTLEALFPPAGAADLYPMGVDMCNREMAKAILFGGWMTFEGNSRNQGSFDQGQTSLDVHGTRIQRMRNRVEDSFQRGPTRSLAYYNFQIPCPPRCSLGSVDEKDALRLAQVSQILMNGGKQLDDQKLADYIGLPSDLIVDPSVDAAVKNRLGTLGVVEWQKRMQDAAQALDPSLDAEVAAANLKRQQAADPSNG